MPLPTAGRGGRGDPARHDYGPVAGAPAARAEILHGLARLPDGRRKCDLLQSEEIGPSAPGGVPGDGDGHLPGQPETGQQLHQDQRANQHGNRT